MPWTYADLCAVAGAPKASTGPFSYVFKENGTQHVDYVSGDGQVHELWRDDAGWHHLNLTSATGSPLVSGDRLNGPAGYIHAGQQHVIFVCDTGDAAGGLRELWRDAAGWHHNDLTQAAGGPPAVAVRPCGYSFPAQGTQHVDYIGRDGRLHELWWDSDGWHHHDLTQASGAPLPDPSLPILGYAMTSDGGSQHVVYIGADRRVHELLWSLGTWYHNDLITWTGAPLADSHGLAGYPVEAPRTQHIYYVGGGHVHELWADNYGWWRHDDLSAASGTPGPQGGVLCAYAFETDGTRHVMYASSEPDVHELWRDENGWHHNDLTLAAGAPATDFAPIAGYATAHSQHVNFVEINNLDICELKWRRSERPIEVLPQPFAMG